jgi:hypothetical protein
MPEKFYKEIKKRGLKRWRTILLGNGNYAHLAIVGKKGKEGGHTLLGEIRKRERA